MIIEGLKLAMLGMTVVFIFLVLLILIVHLSTWLLKSYTEKEQAAAAAKPRKKASPSGLDDQKLTAVIAAAIAAHRAKFQTR